MFVVFAEIRDEEEVLISSAALFLISNILFVQNVRRHRPRRFSIHHRLYARNGYSATDFANDLILYDDEFSLEHRSYKVSKFFSFINQ